jgi:predicted AlkP superfamily phosphohydrolase/phosphomutase
LILPGSTRPLCRAVFTRDQLFSGPFEERLPDVIAELDHGVEADLHFAPELFAPNRGKAAMPYRGYHMRESIFVMTGPGISVRRAAEHAHVRDFLPTILRLLDVPVPADRHGRFLPDLR